MELFFSGLCFSLRIVINSDIAEMNVVKLPRWVASQPEGWQQSSFLYTYCMKNDSAAEECGTFDQGHL